MADSIGIGWRNESYLGGAFNHIRVAACVGILTLTEYMHVWYFISSALAYFSGMITNFTLNKIFNFANRSKKIVQQFSIFATVALVGLGINQLIIYSLVEYLGFWYMYAKFISVVIVMLYSFIGHKELTFKIFN